VTLRNFFSSSSFRLVAWCAAVFGVSVAVLLLTVYWITLAAIEQQLRDSVERESRLLVEIHAARGHDALLRGVQRRISDLRSPRRVLLLQDASGRLVAGNLPVMTPVMGWTTLDVPAPPADQVVKGDDAPPGSAVIALGRRLPGGEFLLVGENLYRAEKAEEAIALAFAWGIVTTVLLALGGGALITAGFLKRIEEVNRTSRSIMDGNLSNRVPTRGSGDEMDQLAFNLNAMLDRIQALMESVKRVSDDIAHDLRTPLSRLRQRLELARARVATPEGYAAVMDQSIVELDAILETFQALLRIAQIEAGTRHAAFAEVDLDAIVFAVAETFAPVAEDSGHKLQASVEGSVMVHGDRGLLTQMAANLLENSIRHCAPGAAIAMTLTREGGVPVLRISDTGRGIPEAEREKVFRRFYRLETSRTTPGNGLGLALVKAVADLHGAAIELSDNGPGLRVTVRFSGFPEDHASPVRTETVPEQPAFSADRTVVS
jgi:signal transduction histidine kinase